MSRGSFGSLAVPCTVLDVLEAFALDPTSQRDEHQSLNVFGVHQSPLCSTRRARRMVNHPPPAPRSATTEPSAILSASMIWSGFCHSSRSCASSSPRSWALKSRSFGLAWVDLAR